MNTSNNQTPIGNLTQPLTETEIEDDRLRHELMYRTKMVFLS